MDLEHTYTLVITHDLDRTHHQALVALKAKVLAFIKRFYARQRMLIENPDSALARFSPQQANTLKGSGSTRSGSSAHCSGVQSPETQAHVVLDLEQVNYIDHAGMECIISLLRSVDRLGGTLSLINVSEDVKRPLKRGGILDIVRVSPVIGTRIGRVSESPVQQQLSSLAFYVPPNPSSMELIRHRLTDHLRYLKVSDQAIFDLILACGEALGNAFYHGGCSLNPSDCMVRVSCVAYQDRVVIKVSDEGAGFSHEHEPQALPQYSAERGRGIKMMYLLVDSVSIAPSDPQTGRGTCVTLIKLRD